MKKKSVIQLKPNARVPYMRVWCDACKTMVKQCKRNALPLGECEKIHSLQYRFVAFIPGTKKRIVRALGKNYTEALKRLAELREQIESGEITEVQSKQSEVPQATPIITANIEQPKPEFLPHLFGKYLSTLKGEGVPAHLVLVRSKGHINDTKNCFKSFCLALAEAGHAPATFRLTEISDDIVGIFHSYIIAKQYSNETYNRWFSHMTSFSIWCDREGYGNVRKFFGRVPRKAVTPRPEIITAEEFEKLLSVITYENGLQRNVGKHKRSVSHFRDYLIPGFRGLLLTGRRTEELLTARFSDINTDEDGRPAIITFIDHKVSRILHAEAGNERKVHTPVTKEIADFLDAQGYQEKKNTDEFILASEIQHNRVASMRAALSNAFTHYWKIAHPDSGKKATLKTLRKTYLTRLAIRMGKNVKDVSGHKSDRILRHYVKDEEVALAQSLDDFSVFGKEEELKAQRKSRNQSQDIER